MVEASLVIRDGRICYEPVSTRKDVLRNITVLLPSRRILHPGASMMCLDIDHDIAAVRYYITNRRNEYVDIVDLRYNIMVYHSKKRCNGREIAAVLRNMGIDDEAITWLLDLLLLRDE